MRASAVWVLPEPLAGTYLILGYSGELFGSIRKALTEARKTGAHPLDPGQRGSAMIRWRLPNRRPAESFEFEHGTVSYVATMGRYADGRLSEIFLSCTRAGSALDSAARDAAIIASLALQHGADPEALQHALGRDSNGAPLTSLAAALDLILAE